jgi:hypothetical protein
MTPMRSNEERIKLCIVRHPEWNDKRIRNSINVPMAEIKAIRAGLPLPLAGPTSAEAAASPRPGPASVSIGEIRYRLDTPAAIRREISRIGKGQLLQEDELCRVVCGRDRNRFRRAIDNNPDLARAHRIKLRLDESGDGKYFWGSAEDIAEATRLRDL